MSKRGGRNIGDLRQKLAPVKSDLRSILGKKNVGDNLPNPAPFRSKKALDNIQFVVDNDNGEEEGLKSYTQSMQELGRFSPDQDEEPKEIDVIEEEMPMTNVRGSPLRRFVQNSPLPEIAILEDNSSSSPRISAMARLGSPKDEVVGGGSENHNVFARLGGSPIKESEKSAGTNRTGKKWPKPSQNNRNINQKKRKLSPLTREYPKPTQRSSRSNTTNTKSRSNTKTKSRSRSPLPPLTWRKRSPLTRSFGERSRSPERPHRRTRSPRSPGRFGLERSPSPRLGRGRSPSPRFGLGRSPSPRFGLGRSPSPRFGLESPRSPFQRPLSPLQRPSSPFQRPLSPRSPSPRFGEVDRPMSPIQRYGMERPRSPLQRSRSPERFGMERPSSPMQRRFGLERPISPPSQRAFGLERPRSPSQRAFGLERPRSPPQRFQMEFGRSPSPIVPPPLMTGGSRSPPARFLMEFGSANNTNSTMGQDFDRPPMARKRSPSPPLRFQREFGRPLSPDRRPLSPDRRTYREPHLLPPQGRNWSPPPPSLLSHYPEMRRPLTPPPMSGNDPGWIQQQQQQYWAHYETQNKAFNYNNEVEMWANTKSGPKIPSDPPASTSTPWMPGFPQPNPGQGYFGNTNSGFGKDYAGPSTTTPAFLPMLDDNKDGPKQGDKPRRRRRKEKRSERKQREAAEKRRSPSPTFKPVPLLESAGPSHLGGDDPWDVLLGKRDLSQERKTRPLSPPSNKNKRKSKQKEKRKLPCKPIPKRRSASPPIRDRRPPSPPVERKRSPSRRDRKSPSPNVLRKRSPLRRSKSPSRRNRSPSPRTRRSNSLIRRPSYSVNGCPCCGSAHHKLKNCPTFIEMSPNDRWAIVGANSGMCSKCLTVGHMDKDCHDSNGCLVQGCVFLHHTLLHDQQRHGRVKQPPPGVKQPPPPVMMMPAPLIMSVPPPPPRPVLLPQTRPVLLPQTRPVPQKDMDHITCYNCGGHGHLALACKETESQQVNKTAHLICYHCTEQGHHISACPSITCKKCNQKGHWEADCPTQEEGEAKITTKKYLICFNCNIPGHHIQNCPFMDCKKCGATGHWVKDCTNKPNEFKKQTVDKEHISIDYHHLGQSAAAAMKPLIPPRPTGSLLGFYCERLLARGRSLVLGDEMVLTWRLAGHNDDTLYDIVKKHRPPTRTQLRLLFVKELANAAAGSIPLSVQVSELLDETVDYFMPHDRVNLISDGKLSSISTSVSNADTMGSRQPNNSMMGTMSMRLPSINAQQVQDNMTNASSLDRFKLLEKTILQGISPQDTGPFEGRVENLEPIRNFIVQKMRLMASMFGVTEEYIQTVSGTIVRLLAFVGYSLFTMRRHYSNYGLAALAEQVRDKLRNFEHTFPKGVTVAYITTFVSDFLNEEGM